MARRYDVDFGERRLTVADSQVVPDGSAAVVQHDGKPMASVPQWLSKSAHVWVQCPDVEKAWKSLNRHTKDVLAAGGLLTNEQGALLCIHRLGHWDLPKGKVEPGESIEEAAMREVTEETGIGELSLLGHLRTTYHTYEEAGVPILKTTFWFHAMHAGKNTQGNPQSEEGITDVQWKLRPFGSELLENTYPSILDLVASIPD